MYKYNKLLVNFIRITLYCVNKKQLTHYIDKMSWTEEKVAKLKELWGKGGIYRKPDCGDNWWN